MSLSCEWKITFDKRNIQHFKGRYIKYCVDKEYMIWFFIIFHKQFTIFIISKLSVVSPLIFVIYLFNHKILFFYFHLFWNKLLFSNWYCRNNIFICFECFSNMILMSSLFVNFLIQFVYVICCAFNHCFICSDSENRETSLVEIDIFIIYFCFYNFGLISNVKFKILCFVCTFYKHKFER